MVIMLTLLLGEMRGGGHGRHSCLCADSEGMGVGCWGGQWQLQWCGEERVMGRQGQWEASTCTYTNMNVNSEGKGLGVREGEGDRRVTVTARGTEGVGADFSQLKALQPQL